MFHEHPDLPPPLVPSRAPRCQPRIIVEVMPCGRPGAAPRSASRSRSVPFPCCVPVPMSGAARRKSFRFELLPGAGVLPVRVHGLLPGLRPFRSRSVMRRAALKGTVPCPLRGRSADGSFHRRAARMIPRRAAPSPPPRRLDTAHTHLLESRETRRGLKTEHQGFTALSCGKPGWEIDVYPRCWVPGGLPPKTTHLPFGHKVDPLEGLQGGEGYSQLLTLLVQSLPLTGVIHFFVFIFRFTD